MLAGLRNAVSPNSLFHVLQGIAIVSVGSFTIAAILLSGLFVYDVFWVFGTEVMVTVAKAGVTGTEISSWRDLLNGVSYNGVKMAFVCLLAVL